MLTYFVHSTSTDNEAGIRSGWGDPELSQTGIRQAETLRDLVSNLEFDFVYCSDLRRAAQTASITFPNHEVVVDCRLREMNYGVLNGQSNSEFLEDDCHWIETPFEGGESCKDVEARIAEFASDHLASSHKVAVVSHRFPQLAFDVLLKDLTWEAAIRGDWRHRGEWQPGFVYV